MKTAKTAICVYEANSDASWSIMSYSIIASNGSREDILRYEDIVQPYHYKSLDSMVITLVRLAKNEGYFIPYYHGSSTVTYNIQFICASPNTFEYGNIEQHTAGDWILSAVKEKRNVL